MKIHLTFIVLIFALLANSCNGMAFAAPVPTVTAAPTALPTETSTPLPTPTVTPFYLKVTVWTQEPRVPVLTYHQFAPDTSKFSTDHKVRLADFRAQLESLDKAGFTLVAVDQWINGHVTVPAGRRPLVFAMDDLFYNNQITLGPDGVPDPSTGIGVFWQFYQQHTDFGFKLALFSNLGDKFYANPDKPDWQEKLAKAIAWCMDHGALVYNHTYLHAPLDKMQSSDITWELQWNDRYLRKLLTNINRQDLIPKLGNMLAVPFGLWPNDVQTLTGYKTPEGLPMQALFDIDPMVAQAKYLLPPYSPYFNRYRIPRIAAHPDMVNYGPSTIDYLVQHKNEFPLAQECALGPLGEARITDTDYLIKQIGLVVTSGVCPAGIYSVNGRDFDAQASQVTLIYP